MLDRMRVRLPQCLLAVATFPVESSLAMASSPDPVHTDRNAPRASGWSAGARDLPHLTLTI